MNPGFALEEYKVIAEFLRLYLIMRFYRLTLLLGTSAGIIGGLCSDNVRARGALVIFLLKLSGVAVTSAFTVVDWRAASKCRRLRERANTIAEALEFQRFPVSSPWNPGTATGADRYLHLFILLLWLMSLLMNPHLPN